MDDHTITLLPILLLCLTPINAYIPEPPPDLGYLEKTSDCAKDLPPGSPLKFHLYSATYEELIKRNDFFIDKTLLLKEIFKENASFLTVFYLPRKFGKSISLQMIRFFAETKLDSNNSVVPANTTLAYDFFTRGKLIHEDRFLELLKKPPLISTHFDLISQHLGQYPVIYFNLSHIDGVDFISTWNQLRDRVGAEFRRYSFLAGRISINESIRFGELVEYFDRVRGLDDRGRVVDLPESIECLAKMVNEYYKKKPILLIDDYDTFVDSFLHDRYVTRSEDEKVLKFFGVFIRMLGYNSTWDRVILTGTYSVHKVSLESLNVTKTIHHALGNNLSYFFGFTEPEVEALAGYFRMTDEQLQLAREMYKGYRMGPHYPIYNPWSILKYFHSKVLENHWEHTLKYTSFLKSLYIIDKMRNVWIGLLGDRTRCVTHLFEDFTERDLWMVKEALTVKLRIYALSPRKFTQILMYLADFGYLTWMRYHTELNPQKTFNVWLPNELIKRSSFLRLRAAYTNRLKVKTPLADEAALKLHSYLRSDRPGQLFLDVMRSFQNLYNVSEPLFEKDNKFREPKPRPMARHIADYIGLRMRYFYEYKLDPMFKSGFLLRKSNVSYVISFNYNESVESGVVLERLRNYSHPWTILRPETKTVKYVVISVANDSDAHLLSYTANLPADYSPPTYPPTSTAPSSVSETDSDFDVVTGEMDTPTEISSVVEDDTESKPDGETFDEVGNCTTIETSMSPISDQPAA